MNIKTKNTGKYVMLKALRGGKPVFVGLADSAAVEEFRNRHGNQDLLISTWRSTVPDMLAPRNHLLCFHITSRDLETARISALEATYYITESFSIPTDCMEIIYNGGGEIGKIVGKNNVNDGENDSRIGSRNAHHTGEKAVASPNSPLADHIPANIGNRAGQNADNKHHITGPAAYLPNSHDAETVIGAGGDDISRNSGNASSITAGKGAKAGRQHNPVVDVGSKDICGSSGGAKEGTSTAEIMILIQPVVFDGLPTPLMLALHYHLARQMADDGIENINIDVYQWDHFIALPNSVNTVTGRFIIPLTMKELLYLDANGIAELSKQPRPGDSLILPRRVPEAADWFTEIHAEFEKKLLRQDELQKLMLQKGWEVTPCIRRLQRLCLYDNIRLEAYRLISQFYSWIGAGPDEIRYLIHSVDRRNPIRNYQKMKAIITFAIENPWFVGCQHPLLERFCSAGKCFMAELIEEYENPYLFEQV